MLIAVILAGIADPKRPLEPPSSGRWADLPDTATTPFKLSPFDEAALELALKLRDKNTSTLVSVIVTDGSRDVALMRAIAAYRPDHLQGLPPPAGQRGNPSWISTHVMAAAQVDNQAASLILIGREHGDLDDGMLAPFLAERCQLPFVGQASFVRPAETGGWIAERSTHGSEEWLTLPTPACISISNDKRNRLRHPLMKNVVLAKQQTFSLRETEAPAGQATNPILHAGPPEEAKRGRPACRMLQGTPAMQAVELGAFLQAWKNGGSIHAG